MHKLALAAFAVAIVVPNITAAQSREEIARHLIAESRAMYHRTTGPCACPYDLAINGSECGGRSAYAKNGGLYCYPRDVPESAIERYRHGR